MLCKLNSMFGAAKNHAVQPKFASAPFDQAGFPLALKISPPPLLSRSARNLARSKSGSALFTADCALRKTHPAHVVSEASKRRLNFEVSQD
jgi:hypothetical protein